MCDLVNFSWRQGLHYTYEVAMRVWIEGGAVYLSQNHAGDGWSAPNPLPTLRDIYLTLGAFRVTDAGRRLYEAAQHAQTMSGFLDLRDPADEDVTDYQEAVISFWKLLGSLEAEWSAKKMAASLENCGVLDSVEGLPIAMGVHHA